MKVTPIVPITALRNQKAKKRQTKDDFKPMLSRPPDDIA